MDKKLLLALTIAIKVAASPEFSLFATKEPFAPVLRVAPLPWWKRLYGSDEVAASSTGSAITIRTHWLACATVAQLVGTILHEWQHVCGFKHKQKSPKGRNDRADEAGELGEYLAGQYLTDPAA